MDIYVKVLLRLIQENGFEIFVHPIPPVLNETREVVKLYNSILELEVAKVANTKAAEGKLHMLGFFSALLSPDRQFLRPDLVLDGTHLSPRYVEELDKALSRIK